MRILVLTALLSVSFTSLAASIQCAKVGRSAYPVSQDAKKLANHLKVKTCSGKTFKYAVKQLKGTIELVAPTSELVKEIEGRRLKNMDNKIEGFSFN